MVGKWCAIEVQYLDHRIIHIFLEKQRYTLRKVLRLSDEMMSLQGEGDALISSSALLIVL